MKKSYFAWICVTVLGLMSCYGCSRSGLHNEFVAPSGKWKISFEGTSLNWRLGRTLGKEVTFYSIGGVVDFAEYTIRSEKVDTTTDDHILQTHLNVLENSTETPKKLTGRTLSVPNTVGANLVIFEHLDANPDNNTMYFGILRSKDIFITLHCELTPAHTDIQKVEQDVQTIAGSLQFLN